MEQYLSVSDIAERMHVTTNTVNSRIRAGDFPKPDAMIGERYQGWKPSTIAGLQARDGKGGAIKLSAQQLMAAVNEMREAGEIVGAYGCSEATGTSGSLFRLAGVTESFLRSEYRLADSSRHRVAAICGGTPQRAEAETIAFDGPHIVPVILLPDNTSPAARAEKLDGAAERLDRVIDSVQQHSSGQAIDRLVLTLTGLAAEIREHARRVIIQPVDDASQN